jgi:8-oxo-dGTP pyrophosphatase MutT (NUDIX family)
VSASTPISGSSSWLGPERVDDLLTELTTRHPEVEVWAAGGVVHRVGDAGREVLLVHRRSHRDWSLPKGKLDPGESLKMAAGREVEEETGYRCELGKRVGLVRYVDARGREKGVVYWFMTPVAGSFTPNSEVDEIEWVPLAEAPRRCSYRHDADLLGDRVGRLLRGDS